MATDPLVALAERLQARCLGRGLTIAAAESCTGGLLTHTLTEVPGSSRYVLGGLVVYADAVKVTQLDVRPELIAGHGAVSAQVARAMAEGARTKLGADLAVAVTGIAGPGGGTPQKPVGLTYIAVAGLGPTEVRRFHGTGDRSSNKRESVRLALEMLLARIETAPVAPAEGAGGNPDPSAGQQ